VIKGNIILNNCVRVKRLSWFTKNRGKIPGFSLVEIMVCISLFVLVAGLLVANISFLDRCLVRSEVDRIFNTIKYLQQRAVVSGKKQILHFDKENNTYTYGNKTGGNKICKLSKNVKFGIIPEIKGPPSAPKKVVQSPITFKGENIVFHPDGIITSGTVYITDSKKKYFMLLVAVFHRFHISENTPINKSGFKLNDG